MAPLGLLLDHVEGLVLARSWAQGPLLPWPFEFQLCSGPAVLTKGARQRSRSPTQLLGWPETPPAWLQRS